MAMVPREFIEQGWQHAPEGGPDSFHRWFQAMQEAGVYTPAEGWPGYYELHPEHWRAAKQMLKDGTDPWTVATNEMTARREERERGNVICMAHRKKVGADEYHPDLMKCSYQRPAIKAAQAARAADSGASPAVQGRTGPKAS